MVEVLVAALLIALISGGVLMGFGQVSHLSGQQRQRAQATALAQQDQARLRGLAITQLSGTSGNQPTTVKLDGTTYTVTSKSSYISGTGAATCVAGQSGAAADEVAISSSVTWPNINRPPVVVHSVVAPPVGGSVVVSATTPTNTGSTGSTGVSGLAGMTATLTGTTPTVPLVTDSTGCAIFAGLTAGTYALSLTPPSGYIDVNGNSTITSQNPAVTATQTNYITTPTLAQPGTITASFSTVGATGATGATTSEADQFSVQNAGLAQPRVFGTDSTATNNTFSTTVTSGATVYPTATPLTADYKAEAGGCVNPSVPLAGQVPVAVTSGLTATPTLPEPALIVLPYTSPANTTNWTFDDTQAAVSNPPANYSIVYSTTPTPTWVTNTNTNKDVGNKEHDDATATNTATFNFYGDSVTWVGTTARGNGTATVTLDGVAQGTFDEGQASNTAVYKVSIHAWSGLTQGPHILVITVKGAHVKGNANNISIDEFTGTSTAPAVLMTTKPNVIVTDTDSVCGGNPDYPPTQTPTPTGGALQFPGLPWGTYTVCVDNGTTAAAVHDTVTGVSNTSYTSGNPLPAGNLPITLYSGGVGTYGTGPCQTSPTNY
jgi:hypothetical protein